MKVYVVVSHTSRLMGVFSTEKQARACRYYFEDRCPDSTFEIYSDFIDLLEY